MSESRDTVNQMKEGAENGGGVGAEHANPEKNEEMAPEEQVDEGEEVEEEGDSVDLSRRRNVDQLQHNLCISKNTLLEDTASVSQSIFVLLRANRTIELYRVRPEARGAEATQEGALTLVTTYRALSNIKISKIIKLRKPPPLFNTRSFSGSNSDPVAPKDMLVVQVLPLKFMTLELDEELEEFRIVCIHNFGNDVRLQESGRLNQARQGFLQSFYIEKQVNYAELEKVQGGVSPAFRQARLRLKKLGVDFQVERRNEIQVEVASGWVYLADGCKVVVVQLKQELIGGEGAGAAGNVEDELLDDDVRSELKAEYVDVLFMDQKDDKVAQMSHERAEQFLHPTRVVDLNRLKVLVNPIQEYLQQLKDDLQKQSTTSDEGVPRQEAPLQFADSSNWSSEAKDLPFLKHRANIDVMFHRDVEPTDRLQQSIEESLPQMNMPGMEVQVQQQDLTEQAKQRAETKLVSIRDLKVIDASGCAGQSQQQNLTSSSSVLTHLSIYVLHQVHLEKSTGTECKPPSFNLNIYELDLLPAAEHPVSTKPAQPSIRITHCLQRLNHYCKQIVPQVCAWDMMPKVPGRQPDSGQFNFDQLDAANPQISQQQQKNSQADLLKTDLVFIVSNVSVYAYRYERNSLTEVFTTSLAAIINSYADRERTMTSKTQNNKEMPGMVNFQRETAENASQILGFNANENIVSNNKNNGAAMAEENANVLAIKTIQAAQKTIDKSAEQIEVKLDGCTRFAALPNNRLLVVLENQDRYIIHFRFDQAELEIAKVDLVKVNFALDLNQYMVPSSIAVQMYESHEDDADFRTNRNCQSFLVSVTSYFNDQQFFVMKPEVNSVTQDENLGQGVAEKRQIIGEMGQVDASEQQSKPQMKKSSRNPIPDSYTLDQIASLPTLTPVTGMIQLNTNSSSEQNSGAGSQNPSNPAQDILISTGSQQSAVLTLIRDLNTSALAVKQQPLLEEKGIDEVFSLIFPAEAGFALTQYIVLTMKKEGSSGSTRVIEYSSGGGLRELEIQENNFITDQRTISIQSLSYSPQGPWHIIQVTERAVRLLNFDRQEKKFLQVVEYLPPDGDDGIQSFVQALEIRKGHMEDGMQSYADAEDHLLIVGVKRSAGSDQTRTLLALHCQTLKPCAPILLASLSAYLADLHLVCSGSLNQIVLVERNGAVIVAELNRKDSLKEAAYEIKLQTKSCALTSQSSVLVDEREGTLGKSGQLGRSFNNCSTDLTQAVRPEVTKAVNKNWFFKKNILKTVTEAQVVDVYVLWSGQTDLRNKHYLYAVLDTGRLLIYESVPAGYKLYKSDSLEKLQVHFMKKVSRGSGATTPNPYQKCFYGEQQQVYVMIQKAVGRRTCDTCCIVTTLRNGRLLFNTLKHSEFSGILSHARILGKVKQGGPKACQQPSGYFLCVMNTPKVPQEGEKNKGEITQQLSMGIHALGHAFDPRIPANPVSNGVCLKQFFLKGRGVKCMKVHQGQYLIVATFRKVPTLNAPRSHALDRGFRPEKNMAQDYRYALEVYELPEVYHHQQQNESYVNQKWKQLQRFSNMIHEFKFELADEIVSSIESLKLNVKFQNYQINQQMFPGKEEQWNDEFLLVSTIKIESKLDQTLYPSCLYLMKVVPVQDQQTGQMKPQLICLDQVHLKRLVSCLTAYKGHLISVQNEKTDFKIVLQSVFAKVDDGSQAQNMTEQSHFTGDMTQPYKGLKYFIDLNSQQPFPNSIQNMARYVGVELDDYIIIGDIYKSFQIFKRKDAAELQKDKIMDVSRISLKPRFQSRIDSYCIGVYCFGVNQAMGAEELKKLLEVDLTGDIKQTKFFSVSLDGTLRMHEVGGQQALECTAQLNVLDNVLRVLPLGGSGQQRRFLIAMRHGGLLEVKQCSAHYQKTVQMIQIQLSQMLPFKLGMTPVPCLPPPSINGDATKLQMLNVQQGGELSAAPATSFLQHQSATKDLGIAPCNSILQFTRSIRAQYETMERCDQWSTLTTPLNAFKNDHRNDLSCEEAQKQKLKDLLLQPTLLLPQLNESRIVDARLALNDFLALGLQYQEYVAAVIGYGSLSELYEVILSV